ncbi:hypothetical protein GP486_006451 [Trichoglossum hirsutum]|uniref:Uncharacterized protein n=1 Tax=Trichoglossum hirsutum TaxID=265104 RepID=A0A9P8L7E2_9PEZI|nr:hypothetical protein GP486_006451 [Trichoglossum hirsutum]
MSRSNSDSGYSYPDDRRSSLFAMGREHSAYSQGLVLYEGGGRRNERHGSDRGLTHYDRPYAGGDYRRERDYNRLDGPPYEMDRRRASENYERALSSTQHGYEVGDYRGVSYNGGNPAYGCDERFSGRVATAGNHYLYENAYPPGTRVVNFEIEGRNHRASLSFTATPRTHHGYQVHGFTGAPAGAGPYATERVTRRHMCQ